MKFCFFIFLFINLFGYAQDYSDSLITTNIVKNKPKINRFSTRCVQNIMLNQINEQRLILKLELLVVDSILYKKAKAYSLSMLKSNEYVHSKIPEGYIEFIGRSKYNIEIPLTHKHLALQELLGFMQTEYHKSVLMSPNIKYIGIAMSAKLIKLEENYYYKYYIVIHIYE